MFPRKLQDWEQSYEGASKLKVFVTGGSGFIGSHLIENLNETHHKVFNYDVAEFGPCDITNFHLLKTCVRSFAPDVIFHLASLLGTSELMQCVRESAEINIVGTINVLDVCKEFNVPLIFASKINPPDWINPYTITKRADEDYCQMYEEQWNVKICVLQFLHVYGPRQKASPVQKFISTFVVKALKNEDLPIWGTGEQMVDPLFVVDAVKASIRAWENKCWSRVIEVGSGKGICVSDVARMVIKLSDSKSNLKFLPMRPGEPIKSLYPIIANPYKMERFLGIYPREFILLEDGLKITINWWKKELQK